MKFVVIFTTPMGEFEYLVTADTQKEAVLKAAHFARLDNNYHEPVFYIVSEQKEELPAVSRASHHS